MNLLKDFDVEHKHPSPEAMKRWRSAVWLVRNRRRRFRHVADLEKRSEGEKMKQKIQVLIFLFCFYVLQFSYDYECVLPEIGNDVVWACWPFRLPENF